MYPATKRSPKRAGGAPFSQASPRAAKSLSARNGASKAGPVSKAPGSAREHSTSIAGQAGAGAIYGSKAEEYYSHLLGKTDPKDGRHDWTLVQEIDALDHFNQEEQKRRQVKEKNVVHQAQLQEQLQARRNVAEKCQGVWKQWRVELEEDVKQYEKEEDMKKAYILSEQKRFNQEREKQLADIQRRKDRQKEEDSKLEREMMRSAEESRIRQEEAEQQKKQKRRQDMMQMISQAEQSIKVRNAQKAEDEKRDLKLQEDYRRLLDEQDRQRNGYFKEIRDKQQQMMAKFEEGVGNEMARLQAIDDARALREQQEKAQKEKQDQEARERWRRDLAQSGQQAVQTQLSLQAAERQRRREDDQVYLEKVRKEAQIAHDKEVEKERKRKEAILANAEFVRRQILEKQENAPSKRLGQAQMSEIERKLNREKLERACDPERTDGLQSLVRKKEADYRQMNMQRNGVGPPGMG